MTGAPVDAAAAKAGPQPEGEARVAEPVYARLSTRVRALVVDGAVFAACLVAMMVLDTVVPSPALARVNGVLFLALIFLYEPILVWRLGGTLGHIHQNLRVVSDRTGGPPGLVASLVRWLVKALFGVLSFLLMLLTSRHQTLHDRASRSTVQVRHATRARSVDFVAARPPPPATVGVSALRRIVVIGLYELSLFAALSVGTALVVSQACLLHERCSATDDLLLAANGWVWLILALAIVPLGWLGRLPGARAASPRSSALA